MTIPAGPHPATAPDGLVRASDGDRETAAEIIRGGYADGRLSRAEFDQRVTAAYYARTRGQLRALTTDLPSGSAPAARPAAGPEPCLLCLLLCMCPPAGLVYWLMTTRRALPLASRDTGPL